MLLKNAQVRYLLPSNCLPLCLMAMVVYQKASPAPPAREWYQYDLSPPGDWLEYSGVVEEVESPGINCATALQCREREDPDDACDPVQECVTFYAVPLDPDRRRYGSGYNREKRQKKKGSTGEFVSAGWGRADQIWLSDLSRRSTLENRTDRHRPIETAETAIDRKV